MSDDATQSPGPSTDELLDAFEAAWQRGTIPRISESLGNEQGRQQIHLLQELIRIDLEFRWKTRDAASQEPGPTLDGYFKEFAELGPLSECPFELVVHELRVRHWWGDRPPLSEYLRRFPQRTPELTAAFRDLADEDGSTVRTAPPDTTKLKSAASDTDAKSVSGQSADDFPLTEFGDYEILEEIARGGMGIVYKARQRSLNRLVALKMIGWGADASDEEISRFQNEAEAAARLSHPNIVPVYEVGTINGRHYFSMALIEGPSLAKRLTKGPLPPRDAAAMMSRIALAVQFAHDNGIVHRDLKPGNVLLEPTEELESPCPDDQQSNAATVEAGSDQRVIPKITDFGLAKQVDSGQRLTISGQVMGTPGYLPPEQAVGDNARIGPASDTYSLGAMLYCMLVGRPPFQAAGIIETLQQVIEQEPVSPRAINPLVPRDLETICLKCLEKNPERRYRSTRDFANDLRAFLQNRPITARPLSAAGRFLRWYARNKILATSVVAVMLSLTIGLVGTAMGYREADEKRRDAETEKEKAVEATSRAVAATAEKNRQLQRAIAAEKDANEKRLQAVAAQKLARNRFEKIRDLGVVQIFENYDAAAKMPNGTALRQRLVQNGLTLLRGLSVDDEEYSRIRFDIGRAYIRLAGLQGDPDLINLGRPEDAGKEYETALDILGKAPAGDADVLHQRYLAEIGLGKLDFDANRFPKAERHFQTADKIAAAMEKMESHAGLANLLRARVAFRQAGIVRKRKDREKTLQLLAGAAKRFRAMKPDDPHYDAAQLELARCIEHRGELHFWISDLSGARQEFLTALSILQRLAKKRSGDFFLHARMAQVKLSIGGTYEIQGQQQESLEYYRDAFKQWIPLSGLSVGSAQAAYEIGERFRRFGDQSLRLKRSPDLVVNSYERAIEIFASVLRFHPDSFAFRQATGLTMAVQGQLLLRLERYDSLFEHFEQMMSIWEGIPRNNPDRDDLFLYELWVASGRFLVLPAMLETHPIERRIRFLMLAQRHFENSASLGEAMSRRGRGPKTLQSERDPKRRPIIDLETVSRYVTESKRITEILQQRKKTTLDDFRTFFSEAEFRVLERAEQQEKKKSTEGSKSSPS